MKSVNKVQLIGHIGADPEIKDMDGSKMALGSICTNYKYKNKKGEMVTESTWHKFVAWGTSAGIVERFVKKGSFVLIDGRITNNKWETKDGSSAISTQIVVSEIMLLKRSKKYGGEVQQNNEPKPSKYNDEEEDDLPF